MNKEEVLEDEWVQNFVKKWSPWLEDEEWYNKDASLEGIREAEELEMFSPPKLYYHLRKNFFLPIVQHPEKEWGVILLEGPRRVGKTSLIKYTIRELLKEGLINKDQAIYISLDSEELLPESPGERIRKKTLAHLIERILELFRREDHAFFLFLDEITFHRGWARTIKNLIDQGVFGSGIGVIATGSYSMELSSARRELPGRLGKTSERVGGEIFLYPRRFVEVAENYLGEEFRKTLSRTFGKVGVRLGFLEYLSGYQTSKNANDYKYVEKAEQLLDRFGEDLAALLENYMLSGGYPRALFEIMRNGFVSDARYVQDVYELFVNDSRKFGLEEKAVEMMLRNVPHPSFQLSEETFQPISDGVEIKKDKLKKYIEYFETSGLFMFIKGVEQPDEIKKEAKSVVPQSSTLKAVVTDPLAFISFYFGSRGRIEGIFENAKNLKKEEGDLLVESICLAHIRHLPKPKASKGNISFVIKRKENGAVEELADALFWYISKSNELITIFIEVKNTEKLKQRDINSKLDYLQEFGVERLLVLHRGANITIEENIALVPIPLFLLLF